jgi:flagellar assembly protein FliH
MSLSKYYNNSNLFQPETLIKREAGTASGWQPAQAGEQTPFQTQQLPAASVVDAGVHRATSPDTGDSSGTLLDMAEPAVAGAGQPAECMVQQDIDLSNYLELAVAEKKIEAAYQRGLKTGTEKCEADFGDATRTLLNTCQQLDAIRETIIGNSREELLAFALAIAEKIIRISVREQDSTVIATIEEALQRAVKSDEFTVYIHPEDYDTVAAKSADLVAGLSGLNKIVVKKDSSIQRGGAMIDSDNCTIDATIASQFEEIREEVKRNL